MQWLMANFVALGVVVLGLLEIANLVIHMITGQSSSQIVAIINAVKQIPGVKDPGIGQ